MDSPSYQEIDLSNLPSYVPRQSAEILLRSCGRRNPKLRRVLFDLRTKSAWCLICETFEDENEAAYLVSQIINAARDYSEIRGQRKKLCAKYTEISGQCTQLASDIESLLHIAGDAEYAFDNGFAWTDVISVRSLLFRSKPTTSPSVSGAEIKQSEDAWSEARRWVCDRQESFDDMPNWSATLEIVNSPVKYVDNAESELSEEDEALLNRFLSEFAAPEDQEEILDEPTEGALNFIDKCWDFAPSLPDVLRQVSKQISEHLQGDLGASTEAEMVLQSRKSSAKRDYLRALWGRLFSYEEGVLLIFEDSKDKLNKIIADLGTVVLDLGADDIVTEHDVRQSRNRVLPFLEKQYSEFNEEAPPGFFSDNLSLIRRWRN